jgi:hypothetical protein
MEIRTVSIEGQKNFGGKDFPLCISPADSASSMEDFVAYVEANQQLLDDMLRESKAIYFRNFPVTNVQHFDRIIQATGLKEMAYIGGAAVRTQITPRVFTSNESPASEKIPFHHEMSQVPEPPTHLFFYCEIPSEAGGEVCSLLA